MKHSSDRIVFTKEAKDMKKIVFYSACAIIYLVLMVILVIITMPA